MTSHKVANLRAWDAATLDARRLVARAHKCRAYQDCDGFDHYNTASLRWSVFGTAPTIGTAYRRFAPPSGLPGQGLYRPSGTYLQRPLLSAQQTLIGKISYCPLAYPSTVAGIMGFYPSSGSNLTALVWNSAGEVQLWTSFQSPYDALLVSSGPGVLAPNGYYGIEWIVTLSTTATGSVQVWVDGTEVLNATGIVTQPTGYNYATSVQLFDNGGPAAYADDYRVWDNTGTTQCAPIGTSLQDSRLITKLPSGAGALAQFTPNGASANWQCVNTNPPPGDTTYVSGATAGLQDAYDTPSAGFTAAPVMVVARANARKDDSNTRQLAVGVDSGGHTAVGATATLNSTYAFVDGCIPDDPNTSAPWTAVGADGAEFYMDEIA